MLYSNEKTKNEQQNKIIFSANIDAKGFYTLPNNVLRYFRFLNITSAEFLFINALLSVEGAHGIRPKQKTVAHYLGVSPRWIKKVSASLDQKGLIERKRSRTNETYTYSLEPFFAALKSCEKVFPDVGNGGYFRMPRVLISDYSYFRSEYQMNPTQFLTLCIFFMYREAEATAITTKQLAELLGVNESTAKRSIWALHGNELITKLKALGSNERERNLYEIQPLIERINRAIMSGGVGANCSPALGANRSPLNNEKDNNYKSKNYKGDNEKQKNPETAFRSEIEKSDLPQEIKMTLSKNITRTIELKIEIKKIKQFLSEFADKENHVQHINFVIQEIYANKKLAAMDIHGYLYGSIRNRFAEMERPIQAPGNEAQQHFIAMLQTFTKAKDLETWADMIQSKSDLERIAAFNWYIENDLQLVDQERQQFKKGRYANGIY